MSNRCYLYSASEIPRQPSGKQRSQIGGISEWSYEVPLVFKVLLSGNPRTCHSVIWDVPDKIAILADYSEGVERLFQFMERISIPEITPLKDEAHRFLSAKENKQRYFLLEAGELFAMDVENPVHQNAKLLDEIMTIENVIPQVITRLASAAAVDPKQSSKKKVKSTSDASSNKRSRSLLELGFGYWSNQLYFG